MIDTNEERARAIINKYKKYINPSLARLLTLVVGHKVEWKANGTIVRDITNREYIDFLGGFGVFNIGHCHSKVVESVHKQIKQMPLSTHAFFSEPLAELGELLAEITPGDLQYSFICNSGAEANEGALKLARIYTKKYEIISTYNSFHGKTMGALSATGRERYKKPFKPLVPGFRFVPYGDIEAINRQINPSTTAAVILEPIQGEGGIVVPSDEYFPKVSEICKRKKVLLIIDEVQTGLGRTGKLFCCEHYRIKPDIMTVGKALGGGVMPVAAFIGTPKVWKPFSLDPLIHTSTFGGNPLACQAAIATIKVILQQDLHVKAATAGEYFIDQLNILKSKHPKIISKVRGKGLLIGVELSSEEIGAIIVRQMFRNGIIVGFTLNNPKVIRFEPPLIISKKEINLALRIFEESLIYAKSVTGKLLETSAKLAKMTGLLRY